MNCLRPRMLLIVAAMGLSGCGPPSEKRESTVQSQRPATDTQSVTDTQGVAVTLPAMNALAPIEDVSAVTKQTLQSLEKKHSCQLPDDYGRFLLENNGGFPSPDCVIFEEGGRKTASDVFCFFAINDERAWASLEWHCENLSGRLPKGTLPISRDSCGNLWLLAVTGKDSGAVFFWDHGSFDTFDETDLNNWPRIANSFQEFRDKLSVFDAAAVDREVASRYEIVKKATDGMLKSNADFSTRANPEFVWHCDCSEDGKVRMQFVQYQIHAITTHTDGYSRLRAIKGVTEKGPMRLP